jgi:pimeloyl-ACP methyl ester carboxylesterase
MGPRGWQRRGHDHGAALARDLGLAPVYLHYNTGRHVSENGREFAAALERCSRRWPVPVDEITVVAHSMGGLVARSACHYGAALGHAWPGALRRLVFLGTPHHGAPLERAGHRASAALGAVPYAAAYARIGRLRSAGVTDLRHGNLLDEDWAAGDRFGVGADGRRPLPLPAGLECHAFAAALGARGGPPTP